LKRRTIILSERAEEVVRRVLVKKIIAGEKRPTRSKIISEIIEECAKLKKEG